MTRLLLALALCVGGASFAPSAVAGPHHEDGLHHEQAGHPVPEAQQAIAEHVAAADEQLRELKSLLEAARSPAVQKEIARKADRIQAHLEQILAVSDHIVVPKVRPRPTPPPVVIAPPPPPPEPAGPVVVSGSDFSRMRSTLIDESFDNHKLPLLEEMSAQVWFEADQARSLLEVFDHESYAVDAAVMLYPRVLDKQNWYTVYEAFTFESNKKKIRKALGL